MWLVIGPFLSVVVLCCRFGLWSVSLWVHYTRKACNYLWIYTASNLYHMSSCFQWLQWPTQTTISQTKEQTRLLATQNPLPEKHVRMQADRDLLWQDCGHSAAMSTDETDVHQLDLIFFFESCFLSRKISMESVANVKNVMRAIPDLLKETSNMSTKNQKHVYFYVCRMFDLPNCASSSWTPDL